MLLIAALSQIHEIRLLQVTTRTLVLIIVLTLVEILLLLLIRTREIERLEKEIAQIHDIVLDPNMPRINYRIYIVIGIVSLILSIIAAVLAWIL